MSSHRIRYITDCATLLNGITFRLYDSLSMKVTMFRLYIDAQPPRKSMFGDGSHLNIG